MASLHIAISPETLFKVGGFEVTNTLFTSYFLTLVIILFLVWANQKIKNTNQPAPVQNFLETIIDGLYNFFDTITGDRKRTSMLAPLIISFFFFIALNNWVELLPGFHTIVYTGKPEIKLTQVPFENSVQPAYAESLDSKHHADPNLTEASYDEDVVEYEANQDSTNHTSDQHAENEHHGVALLRGAHADLNMTLALALISVISIQLFGLKALGLSYLTKYFNFSSPIMFFVGLLELVSEFSKILSFAFRLFGNIFAGEVLIGVISFLIPAILPIPFIGLEIFVGFIQALVFSMLSLVFMNMAITQEHH